MDGINRHILTIAINLSKISNIEVAVCTVFPKGDLNKELAKNNIKTFSLDAKNGHELKIIPAYYKIIKSYAPDIIHIHVMSIFERIISALLFRHIKYVITIHGIITEGTKSASIRMKFEKLLYKIFNINYSATLYISLGVKEAIIDKNVKNPNIIYNAIELNKQNEHSPKLRKILNIEENSHIIGTSCRIAMVKQPYTFTDIMCQVLSKDKLTHAVVIGDGEKEIINECKNIVEKYGVKQRFHWLGYRKDAPELIKEFNCFLLTSISEGLPTSLLECMAMKVPFAFIEGNGGLKDIAEFNKTEGKFALCTPLEKKEELVNEILDIIYNSIKSKEYVDKAYEVANKHFNINHITSQLYSVYKDLI
ncbi:MAG: glycosyltransferase [Bacteroidales bacterium]|nr:glycosyltransferase [Bacteroidales bacterium]